jgi:hypothetical protein
MARKMTISDALKNARSTPNDPLFVINRSDQHASGVRGDFHITVSHEGEQVTIRLPATHIPIDLSEQCVKASIVSSPNFLSAVRNGYIEIIPTEDAEEILSTKDAQQEQKFIQSQVAHRREVGDSILDGAEQPVEIEDEEDEVVKNNVNERRRGPSVAVVEIVGDEKSSSNDKVRSLRNIQKKLSDVDKRYLMANGDKVIKDFVRGLPPASVVS